jgi:hypothetical protein
MEASGFRFWIFQAHPERYDIEERLVAGQTETWVVSSFADEIAPGDVVYLWRASSDRAIYGWGVVNSEVFELDVDRSSATKSAEGAPSTREAQPRVELGYRVRFETPITRDELRSRTELAALAPLRTASGTNFPVESTQALAMNELLRERGLEAPPDPREPPDAAIPSPSAPVRWGRLSRPAQEVFGWAAASESPNPRVGTRGVLIGLVRVRGLESEAAQLLRFVDRTPAELFESLQRVRPKPEIDANVSGPIKLTDLPPLTDNARRALDLAFALPDDAASPVDVKHLFGGLLDVDQSRAYQALNQVLEDGVPIERIAQTYRAYLAKGGLTYRDFLQETLGARERFEWISDAVAQDDLLKRRKLAEVIADRLRLIHDAEADASFMIHIDGEWGSGKSTLLDYLAQNLEAEKDGRWLVVRYDAWRETRVGPPWWTLLIQLRQALDADLPNSRRRVLLRAAEARVRVQTAGLLYALVLAIALLCFILIGADQASAYITAIGALIAGALAVGRLFLWDSAQGARVYENLETNPMEHLTGHFAWLISRSKRPVVFLIDELDRCSATQVVDLIDAIQTLIRDAPRKQAPPGQASTAPYFVVAADGAWIRRSYELAHERMTEAVAEPGRPLGHLFLAKIFQLTVKMPSLSPELRAGYLHSLLSQRRAGAQEPTVDGLAAAAAQLRNTSDESQVLDVMTHAAPAAREALAPLAVDRLNAREIEREVEEHVLDKFGSLLEPNPRAIKRLVIAYGIERTIRTLEGNVVPRDTLVLWTILSTRWPGLGEYLTERPEAIEDLRQRQAPPEAPPELAPLFSADAVAEVVDFATGGPLTKERIAKAAGINLDQPRRRPSHPPGEPAP